MLVRCYACLGRKQLMKIGMGIGDCKKCEGKGKIEEEKLEPKREIKVPEIEHSFDAVLPQEKAVAPKTYMPEFQTPKEIIDKQKMIKSDALIPKGKDAVSSLKSSIKKGVESGKGKGKK